MASSFNLHAAPGTLLVGAFITEDGLEELARFKYVSGPYTVLDNVLNPWWFFVTRFVPGWCSPNAVTLTGLSSLLIALAAAVYVRSGDSSVYLEGHLVFLFGAFATFLYQTMDAVDGKHARSTGQSTPLGAMFDHACDAVAASYGVWFLELVSSYPATEAEEGRTPAGVIAFLLPLVAFFAAQWEHLYTRAMPAGGVTECQFCGMLTMVVATFCGPALFQTDVLPFLPSVAKSPIEMILGGPHGVLLKRVMHLFTTIFATVLVAGSVTRCIRSRSPSCLLAFSPVVLLVSLAVTVSSVDSDFFSQHRFCYLVALGLVMVDLNSRMVIAAVCHFHFPQVQITLLPVAVALISSCVIPGRDNGALVKLTLLWVSVIWQAFCVLSLASNTITRVCNRLEIPFLRPLKAAQKSE